MANESRFRPLDDLPLGAAEAGKLHADLRLKPTVDFLTDSLDDWLKRDASETAETPHEAPRIGLFGGLGQGKSTAMSLSLAKLSEKRKERAPEWIINWHDKLFGEPVVRFDVSHFKADDLEWRFLTAVLNQRTTHTLIWCWLPPFLIMLGFLTVLACWQTDLYDSSALEQVGTALLSLLVSGAAAKYLMKCLSLIDRGVRVHKQLSPASGLFVSRRDWWSHRMAQFTGTLPRAVIVDDLDRAKVEQQRAFLRAILRFSRQMNFAVVVCMDEAAILASKPDPEAPEELLRKTIQLELHLPDRNREDLIFLVANLCNAAAARNPKWRTLLRHPQWIGDLVRCLLLLGPVGTLSPRLVKHLLNAVIARAEQLDIHQIDDCCALIRLEGLLQLIPDLRRHNGKLLDALESNRVSVLEAALAGSPPPPESLAAALHFFARTRMMQPSTPDGWFKILGALRFDAPQAYRNSTSTLPFEQPEDLSGRSLELLRLMSTAVEHLARGYAARLDLYGTGVTASADNQGPVLRFDIAGGGFIDFKTGQLPKSLSTAESDAFAALYWPLWLGALPEADTVSRNRIHHCIESWAEHWHRTGKVQATTRDTILDLLRRERLSDREAWGLLPRTERQRLLKPGSTPPNLVTQRLALLDLLPDDGPDAMHHYHSASHHHARRDALWLSGLPPTHPDGPLEGANLGALLPVWPSALPVDGGSSWFETLRAQAGHELFVGNNRFILPDRLAASWRGWSTMHLDTAQSLDILRHVATRGDDAHWSLQRLAAWLEADNPTKLPGLDKHLPPAFDALQQVLEPGGQIVLKWDGTLRAELSHNQRLTAVAVAALCGWKLSDMLVDGLSPIAAHARRGLAMAIFEDISPRQQGSWLAESDRNCLVTLLQGVLKTKDSEDNPDDPIRERIQARIANERDDAVEVFAALNWPPLGGPLPI